MNKTSNYASIFSVIRFTSICFICCLFFNLLIFIMKEKLEKAGLIQYLPPHCTSSVNMSIDDTHLKAMSHLGGSHFYLQQAEACSTFECFPRAQAFKLLSHRRLDVKCPFAFISLFFQLITSALNTNSFTTGGKWEI